MLSSSSSSITTATEKNNNTPPPTNNQGQSKYQQGSAGATTIASTSSSASSSSSTRTTTTATPPPTVQLIEIEIFESTTLRCSVQYLSSNKLSLYGIVEGIFDLFLHKTKGLAIYSQVWVLKDKNGQEFVGAFPESKFKDEQKQCCPENPIPIAQLEDFQVGFSMDLQCDVNTTACTSGASAALAARCYTWTVKAISPATDEHRILGARKFPRRTPPPPSTTTATVAATASSTAKMLSAADAAAAAAAAAAAGQNGEGGINKRLLGLGAPMLSKSAKSAITRARGQQNQHALLPAFLTAEEIEESMRVRRIKEQIIETVWNEKLNKPQLAKPPMWGDSEKKAICLLQYSGLTYGTAWSLYFEPSFLSRTKTASSVMWYSQKAIIAECDVLHNERHWLHNGGRLAGETELPSKETLIERACHILRACREAELQGFSPRAVARAGLSSRSGPENHEGVDEAHERLNGSPDANGAVVVGMGVGLGKSVNGTAGTRKRRRGLGRADDSDDDLFDGEDF